MRTVAWWLAGSLALVALGCSGGGATSPTAPSTNGSSLPTGDGTGPISVSGALGTPVQSGDLHTSALAIYTVDVNPGTLTATSRLKETRSGQANDDLYMLSIDSFLNAGSFKITSVAADADSVDLGYVVTHPFPAPSNPTGTPNGSTNRADLGISGMVLFLADVPSATGNTYFTNVVANTELVANADAYFQPEGLLTTSGNANTFPYRQLVDELADSRDGVSNSGDVTGNFGTDGWTRSEFGAGNNGWTGFGVLHQGQSSSSAVSLDKDALSGGFSLDVAILAKYNDPRGGTTGAQKKANRLPPATADASLFAYRMPHGALDVSRIVVESDPAGFIANTISSAQLSVHVDDFDANATETAAADLSEDTAFDTVAVGESGFPDVTVCIPGVLGDATVTASIALSDDDSAYGGDAGADSGIPGDALFYSELVSKVAGTGQTAGDFTGMISAADPLNDDFIALDGTLAPTATPPKAITYQAFTVTQLPDNAPPSAVVTLTTADPMNSGTAAGLGITSIADADNDNLDVLVDWGNGGGFVTIATGLTGPAYPNQTPTGPQMNNADLVVDTINMVVRLDDGTTQTDYPVSYDLGPNRAPQVTGSPALAVSSLTPPATFTMNAGTSTATDPEGDAVSYTITNNVNSDVVSFGSFPNAANTTAFATPGGVTFTIYANDALHATTSGTAYPTVAGTIANPCPTPGPTVPGGTPITSSWPSYSGTVSFLANNWLYYGSGDIAGWKSTTYTGWAAQDVTAFGVQNAIARIEFTPPTGYSRTPITAFGAGTIPSIVIDTDTNANNRVFYTRCFSSTSFSTTSPTPANLYSASLTTRSTPNIYFIDYSGGTTATQNTITTTNQVIAFTVNHAGHIYYIDQLNTLHWLVPSGATTYSEVTSGCGSWPINLNSAFVGAGNEMNPAGVGDTFRRAHDLAYNENTKAIYILAQSQLIPTLGNGNGFIYRIESNGTFLPTVNGQPNPRRFVLNSNSTHSLGADISIDNYNSAGALLTGQQDQQMIVTSNNTIVGDAFDIRVFNSTMVNYYNMADAALAPILNTSVSRRHGLQPISNTLFVTTGSFDNGGWLYGTPTNWQ